MKTLTNTLVAATLAFGATAANAGMDISNTKSSEAFLSVYDSVSKQTFTLDLGIAGVTAGTLFDNVHNPDYKVNVDLSQFADWNTFVSKADLDNTIYAVAVSGTWDYLPHVFLTGKDTTFFQGKSLNDIDNLDGNAVIPHARNINADSNTNSSQNPAVNETTLVEDGDGHLGQHEEGSGSRHVWADIDYDINGDYGDANGVDFSMIAVDVSDLTNIHAIQETAAFKVYLTGDTFKISAVPVPAAVWLFGSALLGLGGFSRRVKKA